MQPGVVFPDVAHAVLERAGQQRALGGLPVQRLVADQCVVAQHAHLQRATCNVPCNVQLATYRASQQHFYVMPLDVSYNK